MNSAEREVLFPAGDVHPTIASLAERRAYAVVHEENRDRLSEVFHKELQILKRRGLENAEG